MRDDPTRRLSAGRGAACTGRARGLTAGTLTPNSAQVCVQRAAVVAADLHELGVREGGCHQAAST